MLLAAEPGCALYVGGVYGNDEMSVRLVLCASAQTAAGAPPITGTIQFVSPMSGWSVRRVMGAVQPNGELLLADTIFVETHPSMEWQQCLVDLYKLRIDKDGLVEGEYTSTPCRDRARVALERAAQ